MKLKNPKILVTLFFPQKGPFTSFRKEIKAIILSCSHALFLPFVDDDSSLSALPMVHIAGLVIGLLNPLSQGATVVTLPRFQPEAYLSALQKYRV